MCVRLNEIESQPWGKSVKTGCSQTCRESGAVAQISSRLIWKLCNEGSSVYI